VTFSRPPEFTPRLLPCVLLGGDGGTAR